MEQLVANNALYSILLGLGAFVGGMAAGMKLDIKFGYLVAIGGLALIVYSMHLQDLF